MTPLIIALDNMNCSQALSVADTLDPLECRVKVGKELFTREGPEIVRQLQSRGFDVFLDLKFHDIPHTVAQAVLAAADLGVWMVNVHAQGGLAMMKHAADRLREGHYDTRLIAVTVLTSLSQEELNASGIPGSLEAHVRHLAGLTRDAGLDGVVCSAREAAMVRETAGKEFLKVTPGIRPAFAVSDDQHRIMTPIDALAAGSTHLVIGRPVTRSDNPMDAVRRISEEIAAG
ncbi:orotidine-5'-phosphate decarboxylase [Larsenimonas rhizosphaerae]|uniref:orotidine-5'-phosphate decarboxylase n=1 Tax=Larsenimonas rhizosphaerae TaxID=2944682 RepID=UPI002033BA9C|nr:orotidine-5'-phosphate decarboxylase [Larsenimonas rhizosphaerae]MCM2130900.1 orotidine-5'-phosphate decarboxylase [Larsenimonas rhizosphaerae]